MIQYRIMIALGGIIAILSIGLWVYTAGRSDGRKVAEHAQQERALNAANERANADNDAATGDPLDRLRREWGR